jgi:hypothetical protein
MGVGVLEAKKIHEKRDAVPHYVLITMDKPDVVTRADVDWSGYLAHCDEHTDLRPMQYGAVGNIALSINAIGLYYPTGDGLVPSLLGGLLEGSVLPGGLFDDYEKLCGGF